jgi:hypothetical protein
MDRRTFLRHLLALPIAAQLDVERLLWVPKSIITVPALPRISFDEINELCARMIMPVVIDSYFRANPLVAYFR